MGSAPKDSGDRRSDVLAAVRSSSAPIGVAELAERIAVHPNTVRFHLHRLEESGDIIGVAAPESGRRGRPSIRYQAAPASADSPTRAHLLAHILLAEVAAGEHPTEHARQAGFRWGEAARLGDAQPAEPVTEMVRLLETNGFAPRYDGDDRIDLLECPLREFVVSHGRLACAVHEGMMDGVAAGSDLQVDSLTPFAAPGLCRATLSRRLPQQPENHPTPDTKDTDNHD